jgi:hypothetical protein
VSRGGEVHVYDLAGTAAFMGSTHDLAASGTRLFGLAVGPAKLQVKIYEFALYLDAKQVWSIYSSSRIPDSVAWMPHLSTHHRKPCRDMRCRQLHTRRAPRHAQFSVSVLQC